jgi:hypothetical protein
MFWLVNALWFFVTNVREGYFDKPRKRVFSLREERQAESVSGSL